MPIVNIMRESLIGGLPRDMGKRDADTSEITSSIVILSTEPTLVNRLRIESPSSPQPSPSRERQLSPDAAIASSVTIFPSDSSRL